MSNNEQAPGARFVAAGLSGQHGLSRRGLLRGVVGLGALAAASGPLLAACGSGSSGSAPASGSRFGEVAFKLSWIKNVEYAGSFIADTKGYYKAEGISSVNLISGGASATPMDTDVATNKALLGISSPDITGAAVLKGAPLKIIATTYQENPFAIMSMADKPIRTPQDMYGKKIGVQASNESVWTTFLQAAGLDASKITKVPAQFDPQPLTQGSVDGWFSFITNEPIELGEKGFPTVAFKLADYGYPMVSNTYMARTDAISGKRAVIKAFMRAEIRGWKDSINDPAQGAQLAVEKYGKDLGLNVAEQTLESKAQNLLIQSPDTQKNGLFTMTDELVDKNIATLAIGGVKISASQLFDLSLIKEIYQEDKSLI